jgi:hypothetical protein
VKRFGILLDSGCVMHIPGTKAKAHAALRRWKDARRKAVAENCIVKPRLALGLVTLRDSDATRRAETACRARVPLSTRKRGLKASPTTPIQTD